MTRTTTRVERDTFGPIEVPADRLWGAQTQRSLQNFKISTEKMPPALIKALAQVKRAAAQVNMDLRQIDPKKGKASIAVTIGPWRTPATSKEVRQYLDLRRERVPGTVGIVLVVRPVNN